MHSAAEWQGAASRCNTHSVSRVIKEEAQQPDTREPKKQNKNRRRAPSGSVTGTHLGAHVADHSGAGVVELLGPACACLKVLWLCFLFLGTSPCTPPNNLGHVACVWLNGHVVQGAFALGAHEDLACLRWPHCGSSIKGVLVDGLRGNEAGIRD